MLLLMPLRMLLKTDPMGTTNRQLPSANCCQPPTAANRQPPTHTNHQSPTTIHHQPPTATSHQPQSPAPPFWSPELPDRAGALCQNVVIM